MEDSEEVPIPKPFFVGNSSEHLSYIKAEVREPVDIQNEQEQFAGIGGTYPSSSEELGKEIEHLQTVVLTFLLTSTLASGNWEVPNTLVFTKDSSRDLKGRSVSLCQQSNRNYNK